MNEITIEVDGISYTATYDAFGDDSMFITLPDGSQQDIPVLNGLRPWSIAEIRLKAWAKQQARSTKE